MHIQRILNRLQKHSGFAYGAARLVETPERPTLEVDIVPHARSRPRCSGCGNPGPGYDTLELRYFEFVPLFGMRVFFLYAMRRVDCPACGVKVEQVPWAEGKNQLTTTYSWFLAGWAKRLSWSEVATTFRSTWQHVYLSVAMAVAWGREHMDLTGITSIGVDELQWKKGQNYLTLVYQIDANCKRLLWIGQKRTEETITGFFAWFGEQRSALLQFVCSDMWKPYLTVIAQKASRAVHVLDRFHIMSHLSKAIDEVRAAETREMKQRGQEPMLRHSRWVFLKRPENLTGKQEVKLADLLRFNLRTVRSYLLKEDFQSFWEYISPAWAARFLDSWCTKTMRSRIEPMKKVAGMLRRHRELILNWFRAKRAISAGVVEGFNNKARCTTKRAYGFRTFQAIETALYHTLGDLPEPQFAHRFW